MTSMPVEAQQAQHERVERLVSDHLYLVQHIVHELATRYPRHVDRQELWSAGALGLVEAARRYDPTNGVAFRHFARRRIRGAIIDSTRSRDWASRSVRRHQRELATTAAEFQQHHHRAATDAELAELLGVDVETIEGRRAAVERSVVLHLDAATGAGDDGQPLALADVVATDDVDTIPETRLEQRDLMGTLRTALEQLPEPHRTVVDRYYVQEHLLRDIADELGVTEARISQVRAEAVHALQSVMGTVDFAVPAVPDNAPGRRRRAAYVAAVTENNTWRNRLAAADDVEGSARLVDVTG